MTKSARLHQSAGKRFQLLLVGGTLLQRVDQNEGERLAIRTRLVDTMLGACAVEDFLEKSELFRIDWISDQLCRHQTLTSRLRPKGRRCVSDFARAGHKAQSLRNAPQARMLKCPYPSSNLESG